MTGAVAELVGLGVRFYATGGRIRYRASGGSLLEAAVPLLQGLRADRLAAVAEIQAEPDAWSERLALDAIRDALDEADRIVGPDWSEAAAWLRSERPNLVADADQALRDLDRAHLAHDMAAHGAAIEAFHVTLTRAVEAVARQRGAA